MSKAALEAAKLAKELAKVGIRPNDADTSTDFFIATSARETFNGGSGEDTVSYANSTSRVFVNLSDTFAENNGFAAGDTLISIENIVGSKFDDNILGSTGANIIHANNGNDVVDGGGGSDTILGGAGNDTLQGTTRTGDFLTLNGGLDQDTLIFNSRGGQAEITTGSGNDLVNIRVNNTEEFHLVVTDFQPFLNHNNLTPTFQQSLGGDRIQLSINNAILATDNRAPSFTSTVIGNDLVLRFTDPDVHGDITFQDVVDFAGPGAFTFRIDFDFFSQPQAV